MEALDNLRGRTVVVTGASGYIGSALVNDLVKHSCKVLRVSRGDLAPLAETKSIKADIRTAKFWNEILSQADIIFHLAGNTSVYEATKNPVASLNSTLLPINHLIKAARALNCTTRVVFASTASVYGLTSRLPVSEKVDPKPITIYDMHKLFAEEQLALATHQGLLDSVILRLANVYGPSLSDSSSSDRGVLNKVTAMALSGKDLTVYGDGNYRRDYVYITDVVKAFILAGATSGIGGGVYNLASGVGTTVRKVFELVANQSSIKTGIILKVNCTKWPSGTSSIDSREFVADISSFISATNWQPVIKLDEGIALLIADFINKEAISISCSNPGN